MEKKYTGYVIAVLGFILGAALFGSHVASSAGSAGNQYSWYFQHEPTNALQLYYTPSGSPAQAITSFTSTGSVGIGTASPAAALHVYGDLVASNGGLKIQSTNSTGGAGVTFIEPGGGNWTFKATQGNGGFKIRDNTASQDRFLISNTGSVGIGVLSPTQKLEVNGAVRFAPISAPSNPSAGTMYFDASSKHFFGFDGSGWKQLDN